MFLTPREYFQQKGLRPRKRFGQHFLTQATTAERIVECAGLDSSDVAVEVGPGLGALTRFIMPRVRILHLVELDKDLAQILQTSDVHPDCEVTVHQMDVLRFDFRSLNAATGRKLVIIGNLPYNISSPLGFHLLEHFPAVQRAVFMVQKEVGERWLAGPGGKDYGVLSMLFGIYGRVTPLFSVGPGQFTPPPKVESLVLRIDFRDAAPPGAPPFGFLRKLVSVAFQQRRKTLANGLKSYTGGHYRDLAGAFERAGIDPGRRPETLSPKEFLDLSMEIHLKSP